MAEVYGLPNRVVAEISSKIFENPKVLNYIYYTGKEYEDIDLFSLEPPMIDELVNENIFIGRRIPKLMQKVGAFLDIRVNRYEPQPTRKGEKALKWVEVDIDILCHVECQSTIRGTRDITIVTLLQEIFENEDLTGVSNGAEITSVTEILGLDANYNGYRLKLSITGFNQGTYNE